ncbi:MAG: EAL domain-containing response regulator [Leptospiraceae bacterium]|nr:EAL domain-containing response regulator [Leptospiraceae bacterium]
MAKRIVLVDDDPVLLALTESILTTEYEVRGFSNAEDALFAISADQPDLVISDVVMPLMSGYEFCEKLRKIPECKDIPVLLISAYGDPVQAVESGADDYLLKPYKSEELLAVVRELISIRSHEARMNLNLIGQQLLLAQQNAAIDAHAPDTVTGLPSLYATVGQIKDALTPDAHLLIIYLDVSPLHDRDEIYGWKAFDQLLKAVAEILQKLDGIFVTKNYFITMNRPLSNSIVIVQIDADGSQRSNPETMEIMLRTLQTKILVELGYIFSERTLKEFVINIGYGQLNYKASLPFIRLFYRALRDAEWTAHRKTEAQHSELKREFSDCVRNSDVRTFFQPIFGERGGERFILGYEALSRGPEGKRIEKPEVLFAIAKELSQTAALDFICFQSAVRAAALMPAGLLLFVNVEPLSILTPEFKFFLLSQEKPFPADRLVFEITERDIIDNYQEFNRNLNFFRRLGIRIAIDDAGSGYSSLNQIVRIKPEFVKLDALMVRDIDTDKFKQDIVEAFIGFAHKNGIIILAEGVETDAELSYLKKIRIDHWQGYHLARPAMGFFT